VFGKPNRSHAIDLHKHLARSPRVWHGPVGNANRYAGTI